MAGVYISSNIKADLPNTGMTSFFCKALSQQMVDF